MTINHNKKTIQYSEFELVAAVNYIEHVVEQKDRKTWKLVPEITIKNKARRATFNNQVEQSTTDGK